MVKHTINMLLLVGLAIGGLHYGVKQGQKFDIKHEEVVWRRGYLDGVYDALDNFYPQAKHSVCPYVKHLAEDEKKYAIPNLDSTNHMASMMQEMRDYCALYNSTGVDPSARGNDDGPVVQNN